MKNTGETIIFDEDGEEIKAGDKVRVNGDHIGIAMLNEAGEFVVVAWNPAPNAQQNEQNKHNVNPIKIRHRFSNSL